jgi:hypothetical protein
MGCRLNADDREIARNIVNWCILIRSGADLFCFSTN